MVARLLLTIQPGALVQDETVLIALAVAQAYVRECSHHLLYMHSAGGTGCLLWQKKQLGTAWFLRVCCERPKTCTARGAAGSCVYRRRIYLRSCIHKVQPSFVIGFLKAMCIAEPVAWARVVQQLLLGGHATAAGPAA